MAELNVEIDECGIKYIGYNLEKTEDGLWKIYGCEDGYTLTKEKQKELCEKIIAVIEDFMSDIERGGINACP